MGFHGYLNAYSSDCSVSELTIYEECIGEVLSQYATQELCEAAGHRWDAEVKILQPDVKVNGIESGKLKLEDTLLLTIEKEDTYLMQAQC